MCGIAGIVGVAGADEQMLVSHMLAQLEHRGPDETGLSSFPFATLGARRLSIIDLSQGHQPAFNEDGTVCAVQNGEIYNFRELRERLQQRGHAFRTSSDTEVLPHAYEEFGDEFPTHLRGMFAIAIWDERRQRLVLARDRLGKKPLHVARYGAGLAFASEIQALTALGISREVQDTAIAEYLALGYVPAPHTAFKEIRKIRPGHVVSFSGGAIEHDRPYWRLSFAPKLRISETEALEELDRQLSDAVRCRLISDVPLGAFLSGGLDSSAVVATMAAHSSGRVKTFSIGFSDEQFDERPYARLVAERYATDHREYVVEANALDVLPMLIRHVGEPFADSSLIPSYYVARTARQHVTVALNGDGGDELFAGYDRYRAAQIGLLAERVPTLVRRAIATAAERWPASSTTPRIWRRARRVAAALALPADARYLSWIGYFGASDPIFSKEFVHRLDPTALFASALSEAQAGSAIERLMAIDMRNYLPDDLLVKMDIAAMAASLEARSPLLDQHLVEFVTRLPTGLKQRRGQSKYLLRRLMKDRLPAAILGRRKMGFGAPVGAWMRGPLRSLVDDCLFGSPDRGIVDISVVRRLHTEHMSGRADRAYQLWALVVLELWFRLVVAGAALRPRSVVRAGT